MNYYFFISIVVALLTDTLSGFSLLSDPAPWKKKKKKGKIIKRVLAHCPEKFIIEQMNE